jgi:uncharacterized membrane protein
MRNLLVFLHLAAAIFWIGGMAFMMLALRQPAQALLQPPARLALMAEVLGRFFAVVAASIVVLLATGVWLLMQAPAGAVPPGWHAMAALGLLMVALFGHIRFASYPKLKRAVAAQDWPAGGLQMGRITLLAKINLGLGWLAIAAVMLWR